MKENLLKNLPLLSLGYINPIGNRIVRCLNCPLLVYGLLFF